MDGFETTLDSVFILKRRNLNMFNTSSLIFITEEYETKNYGIFTQIQFSTKLIFFFL